LVTRLRKQGVDVRDGQATDQAIRELWRAVDEGRLRAMAVGGRPRRIVRLGPDLTKSIPGLRSPRGRGFTFLRPSNRDFHQLASWFGSFLHSAVLAFRESEIQKLSRRLMRVRRIAEKRGNKQSTRGRSSLIIIVQPVIRELTKQGKWNTTMTVKTLTRAVNRHGTWPWNVSEDTVTRALDLLHEQTKDRRFERVRYKRNRRLKSS
jgi:hypothetical protein